MERKICEEEKLKRLLVKTMWQLDSFSFKGQRQEKVTVGWSRRSGNRNVAFMWNENTSRNHIRALWARSSDVKMFICNIVKMP